MRQILHRLLHNPLGNNRGMALMVAIASVALMTYIATEVMYDTTVEYNVNGNELNRLKAYYAARGAVEIGMLRVKIYQTVKGQLGDSVKNNPFIDQIWSFPFQWPFPTELLQSSDKESVAGKSGESLMDAQYIIAITDEGSKIDLNDLISPSEALRKNAEKMLKNIFEEKILNDELFRRQYGTFKFDDLIGSMKDWMSDKWVSQVSGDKRSQFSEFQSEELPPNRGFRTIGELRMLPLMDDQLFEILQNRVTVYGLKGVNPNTASAAAIQSLDAGITKEVAEKVITHRDQTPFSAAADFFSYIIQEGARPVARSADDLPLTFDTMTSFRINAQGQYGEISHSITAIVLDIESTAKKIKAFVDKEKETQSGGDTTGGTTGPQANPTTKKTTDSLPKGPPRIVYWSEQ